MKRKKLYYVPGLISLIGISILALWFSPKQIEPLTTIKIFLPCDEKSEEGYCSLYFKDTVYKLIEVKNVTELNLDTVQNIFDLRHSELKGIAGVLKKMKESNDTTLVLKINLTNLNTVGQFVWVVNQTLIHNVKRWAFVDNSFYLFNISTF